MTTLDRTRFLEAFAAASAGPARYGVNDCCLTVADALVAAGVVRRKLDGVRLLGSGELTAKVNLELTSATRGAVAAVEKAGGSIKVSVDPKEKTTRAVKTVPSSDEAPAEVVSDTDDA